MSKKAVFYTSFFLGIAVLFFIIVKPWVVGSGKGNVLHSSGPVSIVQPFAFINQDGKMITNTEVAGKVYVAEFFFTTCKGICPILNNNLKQVYEKYKKEQDVLILSHTCQPEVDSVAQLRRYSDSLGVDTKKWIFLTGRKDSLYTMARLSYTIDDPANNLRDIKDDFLHTQFWALVDRAGRVRKVYDGLKESETAAMIREIAKLLKEKHEDTGEHHTAIEKK